MRIIIIAIAIILFWIHPAIPAGIILINYIALHFPCINTKRITRPWTPWPWLPEKLQLKPYPRKPTGKRNRRAMRRKYRRR